MSAQEYEGVRGMQDRIRQISTSSEKVKTSGSDMITAFSRAKEIVERNLIASERIEASGRQAGQAVASIAEVAQENSAAAEELSASAEEMSAQAQEMIGATHVLEKLSGDLTQQLGRFTLPGAVQGHAAALSYEQFDDGPGQDDSDVDEYAAEPLRSIGRERWAG